MIPIRDNVPRVHMPIMVIGIIALNVLGFLYEQSLGPRAMVQLFHLFGVVPARFFEPEWAAWAGYPHTLGWPLFTYMFLHSGWLHLLLNMWMLWIFGDNIEDVTGHGGFVVFYLLCGLAAVALHMLSDTGSAIPIVGASGAVAGVMGAYVVLYPHGNVLTLVPLFFLPLLLRIPALVFLGVWFLTQIVSGLLPDGDGAASVAWWAHIGGFVAGILLIQIFRRRGHCYFCYNPDSRDYDQDSPVQ